MLYLRPDFASTLADSERHFSRLFSLDGEVCRKVEGRRTIRFCHEGKTYFLKVHTGVGWAEILKNLVYLRLPVTSANTEWRALYRLKELGVDTLTPVGYGCEGRNPARRRSFLITEDLGDTITIEDLLLELKRKVVRTTHEVALKRTLIEKVAMIARTLHRHGVNHRDFYLCHLRVHLNILKPPIPGSLHVYVMDLHRAQLRRRTPVRWVMKDLAGLYFSSLDVGLTPRDWYRFIKAYRCLSLREIFTNDSQFWRKVERRAHRLYHKIHGRPLYPS